MTIHIALIAPYSDISAIGVRTLSSVLKKHKHQVRMIFLPYQVSEIEYKPDFVFKYKPEVLEKVHDLVKDFDVIGISLMTNYLENAISLTSYLESKLKEKTIIWGGIHPTLDPDTCLGYNPILCLGEADEALPEFLDHLDKGEDVLSLDNFYFKKNGKVVRNKLRSPVQELDTLPYQDYNLDDDWVLGRNDNSIIKMDGLILEKYLTRESATKKRGMLFYQTVTSRGCPYRCNFCCWSKIKDIQPDCNQLRRRSPQNVVSELKQVIGRFPFFKEITFSDDSFFGSPTEYVKEFSNLYKKEIGLPFQCLAGPTTITDEKMELFVDAGMKNIQVGVQAASDRILKLYNRPTTVKQIDNAVRTIHKFIPRIHPPIYDFILDNPYETKEEVIETLKFIQQMPQPFFLQIFSLVFFPGTKLYEMAVKDNLIKDSIKDIIHKQYNLRNINYLNILFSALGHGAPKFLTGLLLTKPMIKILDKGLFNHFYKVCYSIYRKMFLFLQKRRSGSKPDR
jgi:anaerobic magnesium-protoporphyrin IX monomethyl ester cyclase